MEEMPNQGSRLISDLDAARLIRDRFAADRDSFEKLTGGDWSQAYAFTVRGEPFVIRLGMHVDDFEKDRAAGALSCDKMPVPEVLEIGQAFDRHFCLSRRLPGVHLDDVTGEEMEILAPAIWDLFQALRTADTEWWCSQLGGDHRTWAGRLMEVDQETPRVFGWHDAMEQSETGLEPFRSGLRYLAERVGDLPDLRHIIHNDLLHHNVLVDKNRISGVFDWGCAMLGDHLYDLAFFTFYGPWMPNVAAVNWRRQAAQRVADLGCTQEQFEFRLRCCEVRLGLSGMAYCAFIRDWHELQAHATRTAAIIDSR